MTSQRKPVLLALQGGGAHGAFTWGVLDHLLEDGRLSFEAISGTSAGAMNAVVMTDGFMAGGNEGARKALEKFWKAISTDGRLSPSQRAILNHFMQASPLNGFGIGAFWLNLFKQSLSPYDFEALDYNPLRDFLEEEIDFARVRSCKAFRLHIAATNVETGKVKVFENRELTADHIMASACLPTIFRAVEIDGVPYWDGGYMGNPVLFPLFYGTGTDDLLLVQINPIERKGTPRTPEEIRNRLNEITFNATLLRELRAIDFVGRLVDEGRLPAGEYKKLRMHRIALSESNLAIDSGSKLDAQWDFFLTLKKAGRKAAKAWLDQNWDDLGVRATIDLKKEYG